MQQKSPVISMPRFWPLPGSKGPLLPIPATAFGSVAMMRDGLRLAGIRDHADEDADFGLPSDNVLHTNYEARTPTTVPGARTVDPWSGRTMGRRYRRQCNRRLSGSAGSQATAADPWGPECARRRV